MCHICNFLPEKPPTTDFVRNVVTQDIGGDTAKQQCGVDSVRQKHTLRKHAGDMQTLLEITQLHQAEGRPLNNHSSLECSLNRDSVWDNYFFNLQYNVFKPQWFH